MNRRLWYKIPNLKFDVARLREYFEQLKTSEPTQTGLEDGSTYGWAITSKEGSDDFGVNYVGPDAGVYMQELVHRTKHCFGYAQDVLFELAQHGYVSSHVRVLSLAPGGAMKFHRDERPASRTSAPCYRLHVPIVTNKEAAIEWKVDGKVIRKHFPANGDAYAINVSVPHRAVNDSKTKTRTHVVCSLLAEDHLSPYSQLDFSPKNQSIIELILKTDREGAKKDIRSLSLFFKMHDHAVAAKYLELMREKGGHIHRSFEKDRTHGFPNDPRDKKWVAKKLNECIRVINSYHRDFVRDRAKPEMDQALMNRLHVHFEKLRGPMQSPAKYFRDGNEELRMAITNYNILIHRYEDLSRQNSTSAPRIVITFPIEDFRKPLQGRDFSHFTKRMKWGEWCLDYCEVGKPIWDVYQDGDDVVGDDNIRPQWFYSANSIIHFTETESVAAYRRKMAGFDRWWSENEKFLKDLGFKRNDPKNAIGHIPIASLMRSKGPIAGLSRPQVIRLIAKYPVVDGVIIHVAKRPR